MACRYDYLGVGSSLSIKIIFNKLEDNDHLLINTSTLSEGYLLALEWLDKHLVFGLAFRLPRWMKDFASIESVEFGVCFLGWRQN